MEPRWSGEKQLFWEVALRSLWDMIKQELVLWWHFFSNILSEIFLSVWPLFYCLVSPRSVWLHSPRNRPSAICGCDYQPLSILFVWQHKPAPSTRPWVMCLRPLTSQPPSARPPVFFFSYASCSGWREGLGRWADIEYSRCNKRSTD